MSPCVNNHQSGTNITFALLIEENDGSQSKNNAFQHLVCMSAAIEKEKSQSAWDFNHMFKNDSTHMVVPQFHSFVTI